MTPAASWLAVVAVSAVVALGVRAAVRAWWNGWHNVPLERVRFEAPPLIRVRHATPYDQERELDEE